MKSRDVKALLETMCEYNTVNMKHVFTTEEGVSLSAYCLPGNTTIEISNSATQEIIQYESIEETTEYIVDFLTSHDLSINS